MTDKEKLDAIRGEIHRLVDVRGYDREMANDLFAFMDSLPNEPVSNDLEDEAEMFASSYSVDEINEAPYAAVKQAFEFGAQWRKEQMIEWLEENLAKETSVIGNGNVTIQFRGAIEAFKKAMEE